MKGIRIRNLARQPGLLVIGDPAAYLRDTGLLFHVNRSVFHPMGTELLIRKVDGEDELVIVDAREAPYLAYDKGEFDENLAKFEAYVRDHGDAIMAIRKNHFGFKVQTKGGD